MSYSWFNSVLPIAALFAFRMLGLFMLIPVFTVVAPSLEGATPMLIGIALGSYGLTQGCLQMPFGLWSDRFGRKPVIALGLSFFIIGSLVGACSHSIYTMILARILQGSGAIGSVLIALLADLTPPNQRTKAMAVIGLTIGISFSLAMILSPMITSHFGLGGLFSLMAVLATLGLVIVYQVIPTPQQHETKNTTLALFKTVLQDKRLQRLNVGIFLQHFILTATFYSIPLLLAVQLKAGHITAQWHFYLPLIVGSFLLMLPLIILAEKKQAKKLIFLISVGLTCVTQFYLAWESSEWFSLSFALFFYFVGFNILEALLPSLVSTQAEPRAKGTAMGIYSSSQFLGLFMGGVVAGISYQLAGHQGIFIVNALLSLIWLIFASSSTKGYG